jgi:hypothetical protein
LSQEGLTEVRTVRIIILNIIAYTDQDKYNEHLDVLTVSVSVLRALEVAANAGLNTGRHYKFVYEVDNLRNP